MRRSLGLKRPGDVSILGFAERHGAIEIWKVGSWYHWKLAPIKTQARFGLPNDGLVRGPEKSGPNLPIRYQRFWDEPATTEEEPSR